jgi:transposase InsO family protein
MHGKAQHAAFGKTAAERTMAARVLWRVHADVCGPLPPTLSGSRYLLLLVDEFTRKIFGFCLARKSHAAGRIVEWCRAAVAEQGVAIVEFHSDGGGEFISRELQQFFQSSGITATTTLPYTPQHNGIAERAIRSVFETARKLLQHAKLGPEFWAEMAKTAAHLLNRTRIVQRSGGAAAAPVTVTPEQA